MATSRHSSSAISDEVICKRERCPALGLANAADALIAGDLFEADFPHDSPPRMTPLVLVYVRPEASRDRHRAPWLASAPISLGQLVIVSEPREWGSADGGVSPISVSKLSHREVVCVHARRNSKAPLRLRRTLA